MKYVKNAWVDQVDTNPKDYLVDAVVKEIEKDVSGVSIAGSPVNAVRMNNIEDGIDELSNELSEDIPITESVTLVPSTVITGQTKPTAKFMSVVNNVDNGNFVNGTTDWVTANTASFTVTNKVASFLANAVGGSISASNKTMTQNHIYFMGAFIKSTSALVDISIAGIGTVNHSGSGVTEPLFKKFTWTPSTGLQRLRVRDQRTSAWDTVEVDGNLGVFLIDMTSLNIESFTDSQMLDLARSGYFDGIKDYDEVVTSVGKNIVNKAKARVGYRWSSAGVGQPLILVADPLYTAIDEFIPVVELENYVSSGEIVNFAFYADGNKNFISAENTNPLTIPSNAKYVCIRYLVSANLNIAQLEPGTVATPYEDYKKSTQRLSGKSVPNIADTESTKNVEKYKWVADDILSIANGTNNQFVLINKRLDSYWYGTADYDTARIIPGTLNFVLGSYQDTTDFVNVVYESNINNVGYAVPLGTYSTLQDAKNDLAGTDIRYQLALPESRTDSEVLTVYENCSIKVAYAPTELILKEASNNEAQTRFGNAEAIGRITNRLLDIKDSALILTEGVGTFVVADWIATGSLLGNVKITYPIQGLLASNWIDIVIDGAKKLVASNADINPTIVEYDGGFTVYAEVTPTEDIDFEWRVIK